MPLPNKLPDDFGKSATSGKVSVPLLAGRFLISKRIGAGNFGTAFLVKDEQEVEEKEKLKVLKQITVGPVDPGETVDAMQEARLLSKLTHSNIVQFHQSFLDGHNFCIIIEYCEGGDLECILKDQKKKNQLIPEAQVVKWIKQLLKALEYMHKKRILHRDLKTRNIFLKNNEIKVGDFGISRILLGASDKASTFVGTPYYMSPEVLKHEQYDEKCDIWSLGCVLYEMCCLEHAFEGTTLMSVMMKIISDHTPQLSQSYSRALNNLLSRMLDRCPEKRQTAGAILTHALFGHSNGAISNMTARDRLRIRKQKEADENLQRLKEIARLQLKENHRIRKESQEKNFLKSSFDTNMQVTTEPIVVLDKESVFTPAPLATVEDVEDELQGTVTFKPYAGTLKASGVHTLHQEDGEAHTLKEFDPNSTDELIQSLIRDGIIPEDAGLADTFYSNHGRFESISSEEDDDLDLPDEHLSYTQGEYRDLMEVMEGALDLDDSTVTRATKLPPIASQHTTSTSKQIVRKTPSYEKVDATGDKKDIPADPTPEMNFTMFHANMAVKKIEKLKEKCREGLDDQLFDKAYKMMKKMQFDDVSAIDGNMEIIEKVKGIVPETKCMNFEELIYLEQQRDSKFTY